MCACQPDGALPQLVPYQLHNGSSATSANPVTGAVVVTRAGEYAAVWDNGHSWYRPHSLNYSVEVLTDPTGAWDSENGGGGGGGGEGGEGGEAGCGGEGGGADQGRLLGDRQGAGAGAASNDATSAGATAAAAAASAAGMAAAGAAAGRPLLLKGAGDGPGDGPASLHSEPVSLERRAELMEELDDACDALNALMGTATALL